MEKIELMSTYHIDSDDFVGVEISFKVNDAFRHAESHSEAELLSTYERDEDDEEYGVEGSVPCMCLSYENVIYRACDEFRENGTAEGLISLTPLSGNFLFKAKADFYDDCIIYFYAFRREDWLFDHGGICMVYQKEYAGTEDEEKLMKVLDDAAESLVLKEI